MKKEITLSNEDKSDIRVIIADALFKNCDDINDLTEFRKFTKVSFLALEIVEIIVELEKQFDINIEDKNFDESIQTVEDIYKLVTKILNE